MTTVDTRPATPATVAAQRRGPSKSAMALPVSGAPATNFAATRDHVSQQVSGTASGSGGTVPGQVSQAGHAAGDRGPECAALALVEAMDGAGRSMLLRHLAQAYPDVVTAGAEDLARARAEAAGRRRKANNRKATLRSRARRRQGA